MGNVKQYIKKDGHSYLKLFKNGIGTEYKVCDLVWESFNKRKIPEGFVVIHIDGNKQNNRLDNLKLEKI